MSPIYRKPAAKKPVAKKPAPKKTVKPATKKPAARKPIRMAGVKKAPAVKRAPAKALRPTKPVAKRAPTVTREAASAQIKQLKVRQEGLAGKTNQDVINVIYKAADLLNMPPWTLLATAKLERLVDARSAPYTGPAIVDLPGLTSEQKAVIQKVLSGYTRPS
jgi:hypothetical protein